MSTYTRPVVLLLTGLMLLTLAIATLNTLVPLWLAHKALATWQVGAISSAFFTGNLLGTLLAGPVIKRKGFNHAYYIAALLFAMASLGLGMTSDFYSWLGWRFLAGIGCAMVWVVVESALLCSGTIINRSRLLAAYMMVYYLGTVGGQVLLTQVNTQLASVLPWAIALILASLLPLLLTHLTQSVNHEEQSNKLWRLLKWPPAQLGVLGCFISGIILGSLYGLMPLYLSHLNMNDARVGFWMALLISAGIFGQWPVSHLTERWGKLLLLRVQVFIVIVGALAMLMHSALTPALFILGASGFTLYPVAMAWACEKVAQHQLVAMNQALLLSYTVGSLVGPAVTAFFMERYSDDLLFIILATVAFIYLLMLMVKGQRRRHPVAHA